MKSWRVMVGYEGIYEVSSDGDVRRAKASKNGRFPVGHMMRPRKDKVGRLRMTLSAHGRKDATRYVHAIVAETFIGPRPSGTEINHIDGDPLNNTAANLEYVSHSENMRHSYRLGIHKQLHGEQSRNARLTDESVRAIRRLRGAVSGADLARRFGVVPSIVSEIQSGKRWTHIVVLAIVFSVALMGKEAPVSATVVATAHARGSASDADTDDPPGVARYARPDSSIASGGRRATIAGTVAVPPPITQPVIASWYGPPMYGNHTACGPVLTLDSFWVAHRTLPCGTLVTLTHAGRTVTVPVLDRGPFIAGRTLDLTAAVKLALACSDICSVEMELP